jgi:hypothetical protein
MKKRRNFLKYLSSGVLAGGLLPLFSNEAAAQAKKNQFVHHVFFWLKKDLDEASIQKFRNGLTSLTTIKTVRMAHLGVPATTNREVIDSSYSYSLLLIFRNLKDQEIYQDHPVHLKFVEECAGFWDRVVVYDTVDM